MTQDAEPKKAEEEDLFKSKKKVKKATEEELQ